MRSDAINYFRCVKCGVERLVLIEYKQLEVDGQIGEAGFSCNNCSTFYPVSGCIPRFVPENNYSVSFGLQWNLNKKVQLDSYTGFPISRKRLYGVTNWPKKMEGVKILEAGSGAGRFTEILLQTGAMVFSFDLSSAVNANYDNNGKHSNLLLFQADILNIPLQKHKFDKVICLGVIQHTPEPEMTFKSLSEYVRPGGELVIDVYANRLSAMLSWKYLLRPFTKRIDTNLLYKIISQVVTVLLPLSILMRRVAGKFGARLLPIVEYSHLGFTYRLNKQWAILDTFDMYSPQYDNPQTIKTVESWFKKYGFVDIEVRYGPNGVVGKGRFAE